ncbi:hypothetical protein TB2_017217 [Malus domestica]
MRIPYPNHHPSKSATASAKDDSDPTRPTMPGLYNLGLPVKVQNLNITNNTHLEKVLDVCEGLFEGVVDRLNDSLTSKDVNRATSFPSPPKSTTSKTWLSTKLTDHETCLDSLADLNLTFVQEFKAAMQNTTEFSSSSLAIVAKILSLLIGLLQLSALSSM